MVFNQFVELNKALHERKTFNCGHETLNRFLQQAATRHRHAGISKTMVMPIDKETRGKSDICAFYTLSHTEILRETLPTSSAKKLPRYPVPVMLIAQLAIDHKFQGQGLGKTTLIKALKHCLEINMHLPSYAVIVDALDNDVQAFYEQYGFKLLDHDQQRIRLYIAMDTLAQLFT